MKSDLGRAPDPSGQRQPGGLQLEESVALAHTLGFNMLVRRSACTQQELAQVSANKTSLVHKALSWVDATERRLGSVSSNENQAEPVAFTIGEVLPSSRPQPGHAQRPTITYSAAVAATTLDDSV
eukprot:1424984-Lingulodinium_polyedra.AAC.1